LGLALVPPFGALPFQDGEPGMPEQFVDADGEDEHNAFDVLSVRDRRGLAAITFDR
jgi:hypothetical protein